jgi:RNA polymerase sigma-32 factor
MNNTKPPQPPPLRAHFHAPGSDLMTKLRQASGLHQQGRLGDAELQSQFHDKLEVFAAGLKDKERFIFDRRLIAEAPLTLQEIGTRFGLTRERVRQIESRLTQKLKEFMARELPDFGEISLAKLDK